MRFKTADHIRRRAVLIAMLTPTLTPTGARLGAVRCASVHMSRIQAPDSEAGGRGFEARLPLQYQAFKKWSPRFVWNGHDADRALWQGLGLEVFEDAGNKTRPLTGIGGLPCGHQVQEL